MTPGMTFAVRVVAVIKGTAPGDVVTYGAVATEAGYPGAARAVGNTLAKVDGLPWWRVVLASGRMAPGKEADQSRRLRAEGVEVRDGRVRRPRSVRSRASTPSPDPERTRR